MREDARRVPTALLLFLLLTAGTVLAAGVTPTTRIAAGPLPERFELAEPRVGDVATFVWARVRVDESGEVRVLNEREILGFEWLAPTVATDSEGLRHEALMLHQWGWQPREHGADLALLGEDDWERYAEPVYAIDLATDRVISYAYLSEATADPERQDPATSRSVQRTFLGPDDRFLPVCGAFPAFGGREVPLHEPVVLFRACQGLANVIRADALTPVQAVGTQRLGEHDTLLFSSESSSLHVWYNASVPFPMRVAARVCETPRLFGPPACADGQYDVLRLTSFRRGSTPLPTGPSGTPSLARAPGWEMAPLVGGLPDETGIDHPFPASAAVDAARRDANGRAFRDVLDRGYVTFLDYREIVSETGAVYVWDVSAYDGTRTATVRVEHRVEDRTPRANEGPLPPLPPLAPEAESTSPVVTTTVEVAQERTRGPWPPPAEVPTVAPTVASMWARWRGFASDEYDGASPSTWGLRIDCLLDRDGACSLYVERWAGVDRETHSMDSSTSSRSILRESHHERRGHEMGLHENWHTSSRAPAEGEKVETASSERELKLIKSTAWITPATPVVVRSAFFAGLASLGYLAWPALRSGAIVLFTRHATPPDVLRNAERRRMMEAVRAAPGLSVPDLARALGKGRNTTEHHLAMLQRVGLLRVVRDGARRRIYSCDAGVPRAEPAALASDVARRLLEARRERPDLSVRDAAKALGVSPGTVSYHLRRLREAKLIGDAE